MVALVEFSLQFRDGGLTPRLVARTWAGIRYGRREDYSRGGYSRREDVARQDDSRREDVANPRTGRMFFSRTLLL